MNILEDALTRTCFPCYFTLKWLTIDLGEATLRRMARSIDNECTNMYNTIVKNMSDDCAEVK